MMAIPLDQMIRQLEDSGILDGTSLHDILPSGRFPPSAGELARELVRQQKLTPFQAEEILEGRAKSLVLGNYRLLDKIGAGGMGQVFKARHRRMDRIVAVKLLPPALTRDEDAIARFEREVKAAAKLTHPNIVTAYDADHCEGTHFLVMEYIEGTDLAALVERQGPLPVATAVNYLCQTARGLEAAHRAGIVHRDVKPANLLLDAQGTVKILDLGLARLERSGSQPPTNLTGTGVIMGTVAYMAPEQAMDSRGVDARADIYSLGCSLHFLLTGQAPYRGATVFETLQAHQTQAIPRLREANPRVPRQLEALFQKMMAKEAADRPQSMGEVIDALRSLSRGRPADASTRQNPAGLSLSTEPNGTALPTTRVVPTPEIPSPEQARRRLAIVTIGGIATVAALVVATYLWSYLSFHPGSTGSDPGSLASKSWLETNGAGGKQTSSPAVPDPAASVLEEPNPWPQA